MKARRTLAVIFSIVLSCMVVLPAALADEWNQATEMKFSEPVEIPGKVLPAGTYWFVLADNQGDRQTVQIFNADRSKLYATEDTAATERLHSTNNVEIKFAERPHQQPEALLQWYYPGRLTGHEFMYRGKSEQGLMRDAKQDIVAPTFSPNSSAMPGA